MLFIFYCPLKFVFSFFEKEKWPFTSRLSVTLTVSNHISWEEVNTEWLLSWLDPLLPRSWRYPLANYRIYLILCTFLYLLSNGCPVQCNPPWANNLVVLRSLILGPVFSFVYFQFSSVFRVCNRCLLQFLSHLHYYSVCMWNSLLTFHTSGTFEE